MTHLTIIEIYNIFYVFVQGREINRTFLWYTYNCMSDSIKVYNEKLLSYYQKAKHMSNIIASNTSNSESMLNTYKIYFKLLDKMEYYNNKLRKVMLTSHTSNKQLHSEINAWRNDALGEYSNVKKNIRERDMIREQQSHLSRLEETYKARLAAKNKYITQSTTRITSILIEHILEIIEYSILLNQSIGGNIFELERLNAIKVKLTNDTFCDDYIWIINDCHDILPPNTMENVKRVVNTFMLDYAQIHDMSDIQEHTDKINKYKERIKNISVDNI